MSYVRVDRPLRPVNASWNVMFDVGEESGTSSGLPLMYPDRPGEFLHCGSQCNWFNLCIYVANKLPVA